MSKVASAKEIAWRPRLLSQIATTAQHLMPSPAIEACRFHKHDAGRLSLMYLVPARALAPISTINISEEVSLSLPQTKFMWRQSQVRVWIRNLKLKNRPRTTAQH